MNYYPKNFAVRLLISMALTVGATNLGMFVRCQFITHEPYVFDVFRCLVLPALIGLFVTVIWKPKE